MRTRRDGRPREGITFLLLDVATPGITVAPIFCLSGEHEVNTVFFEQFRVPVVNRLDADDDFRRKIDAAEIEATVVRFLEARILSALSQGQNPGPESSILKTRSGEVSQRITELAVEAVALRGLVHQPEARVPWAGTSSRWPRSPRSRRCRTT